MDVDEFDKEVSERFWKRVRMLVTRFKAIFVFHILGYIFLWLFILSTYGLNEANKFIIQSFMVISTVEALAIFGKLFWLAYYEIPAEMTSENNKTDKEEKNKPKREIPSFRTLPYHAEFFIKDSNADVVSNFLYQHFKDIPRMYGGIQDKVSYTTRGSEYYTPEDIAKYGLMVHGEKVVSEHVESWWEGMSITPITDEDTTLILDMFYVSVVQGGHNTTQVKFDTQYKDVFRPVATSILKRLKEMFTVTHTKGITDEDLPKRKIKVTCNPADKIQEKPYISIDVTNHENELIKCYCIIKSLKLNGVTDNDIKDQITKETNRVSWSQGSDEEVGVKHIGKTNTRKINLASLNSALPVPNFGFIQFETANGRVGNRLPLGIYSIELGLLGTIGEDEFQEIPIMVKFEYKENRKDFEEKISHGRIIKGKDTTRILRLLNGGTNERDNPTQNKNNP